MEKETYKVAMQILEKFGKTQPAPSPAAAGASGEDGNLRRRAGTGSQACLNTSLPVTTRNTTRASKLNTTIIPCTSHLWEGEHVHPLLQSLHFQDQYWPGTEDTW